MKEQPYVPSKEEMEKAEEMANVATIKELREGICMESMNIAILCRDIGYGKEGSRDDLVNKLKGIESRLDNILDSTHKKDSPEN